MIRDDQGRMLPTQIPEEGQQDEHGRNCVAILEGGDGQWPSFRMGLLLIPIAGEADRAVVLRIESALHAPIEFNIPINRRAMDFGEGLAKWVNNVAVAEHNRIVRSMSKDG